MRLRQGTYKAAVHKMIALADTLLLGCSAEGQLQVL